MRPYVVRCTGGVAVRVPGTYRTAFTIDLPSYWRIKTASMLWDPDTWTAQGILLCSGWVLGRISKWAWGLSKKLLKKTISKIIRKTAGPDYDYTDKIPDEVWEAIMRLIVYGVGSAARYAARKLVAKLGDKLAKKLAEMIAGERKMMRKVLEKLLRPIMRRLVAATGRYVYRILARKVVGRAVGVGMIKAPCKLLRNAITVVIDFVTQMIVENLIDTLEFLLWPTYGLPVSREGRGGSYFLCCGPNVADTLTSFFGASYSRKSFAIYGSWVNAQRAPASRFARIQKRRRVKERRVKTDPDRFYRKAAVVRKPRVRWAARFGDFVGAIAGLPKELSFAVHELWWKVVPNRIGAFLVKSRGKLKVYAAYPLIGNSVGEAMGRDLALALKLDHNDALQGYTYLASLPWLIATGALMPVDRALKTYGRYVRRPTGTCTVFSSVEIDGF